MDLEYYYVEESETDVDYQTERTPSPPSSCKCPLDLLDDWDFVYIIISCTVVIVVESKINTMVPSILTVLFSYNYNCSNRKSKTDHTI